MPKRRSPKPSGTVTESQPESLETPLGAIPLIQRCNDAYWFPDSRYVLSDSVRMASALKIIADEVDEWSAECKAKGSEIVALALHGVAERLRDATNV